MFRLFVMADGRFSSLDAIAMDYSDALYGECAAAIRASLERNRRSLSYITGMWTPLHEAAFHGRFDVCETLIEFGANVNARDLVRRGKTPLAVARCARTCELLLAHGANNDPDDDRITPLEHVIYNVAEPFNICKIALTTLHCNRFELDALLGAAASKCLMREVRLILTFCKMPPSGLVVLQGAARGGSMEIFQLLLDVCGVQSVDTLRPALVAAARHNQVDICRFLIGCGVEPTVRHMVVRPPIVLELTADQAAARRVLLEAIATNADWVRKVGKYASTSSDCTYILALLAPHGLRGAELAQGREVVSGTSLIAAIETRPLDSRAPACDLVIPTMIRDMNAQGDLSTFEVATVFCRRPSVELMMDLARLVNDRKVPLELVKEAAERAMIVRRCWQDAKAPGTNRARTLGQRRLTWPVWERVIAFWLGVPPWWFGSEFCGHSSAPSASIASSATATSKRTAYASSRSAPGSTMRSSA